MKRHSFGLALVLGAMAVCLSGPLAKAQGYKGTFKLDEQVRWGQAVLPAGDYMLSLNSTERGSIAVIRGQHKTVMIMANAADENVSTETSSLLLIGDSRMPSVRALHLAEAGMTLYFPVGRRELELEAQQDSLRVPVAISGK